jgi:DNA-binding transcriptional ArsR family regulator
MSAVPATITSDEAADVFAALGEPTRLGLLRTLAGAPEGSSVTTLAAPLTISRQAVDKHVRILQKAGLVVPLRVGREVRFTLRDDGLRRTREWMSALDAAWDDRLTGLKRAAEATEVPSP